MPNEGETMNPKDVLKFYTPAFRDLFAESEPDLSRFLRLVIDVLDPASGYGPANCPQCGHFVMFGHTSHSYVCPNCSTELPFSMWKGPKRAPQYVTLTRERGDRIGTCKSVSRSGVTIDDSGTCWSPLWPPQPSLITILEQMPSWECLNCHWTNKAIHSICSGCNGGRPADILATALKEAKALPIGGYEWVKEPTDATRD